MGGHVDECVNHLDPILKDPNSLRGSLQGHQDPLELFMRFQLAIDSKTIDVES